jgi:hypothetical protein
LGAVEVRVSRGSGLELPKRSRARDTRRELPIARRQKRFHELFRCAGYGFCAELWTKGCAGGAGRLVQDCLVWFVSKKIWGGIEQGGRGLPRVTRE